MRHLLIVLSLLLPALCVSTHLATERDTSNTLDTPAPGFHRIRNPPILRLRGRALPTEEHAEQPHEEASRTEEEETAVETEKQARFAQAMARAEALDRAASQTHASTSAGLGLHEQLILSAAEADEASFDDDCDLSPCVTCTFVLERLKMGTNVMLASVCNEISLKFPDGYPCCAQVMDTLTEWGNDVRSWMFNGCYKNEVYNSLEWIKPCPSHNICAKLKRRNGKPYCPTLDIEDAVQISS